MTSVTILDGDKTYQYDFGCNQRQRTRYGMVWCGLWYGIPVAWGGCRRAVRESSCGMPGPPEPRRNRGRRCRTPSRSPGCQKRVRVMVFHYYKKRQHYNGMKTQTHLLVKSVLSTCVYVCDNTRNEKCDIVATRHGISYLQARANNYMVAAGY